MTFELIHGDARHVSDVVAPASVDLVVTSPPYFALRSYRDGGEHYGGQIGSEATPTEFLDALIECTRDWLTVLRPGGSIFVNLGDKRAGSGGHNNNGLGKSTLNGHGGVGSERDRGLHQSTRRNAPDRYNQNSDGIPAKSLMGIPWRYALRCIDELGLILRADIVWNKPNGLPESVTDRVRQSHEYWFHLTREPRYFAAVDEIREATEDIGRKEKTMRAGPLVGNHGSCGHDGKGMRMAEVYNNPLGKLPGSVWTISSEPLTVPQYRIVLNGRHVAYPWNWKEACNKLRGIGVRNGRPSLRRMTDHFAAFPSEWPRRLILGWSPSGWCVECGEPRRPVVDSVGLDLNRPQARRANELAESAGLTEAHLDALLSVGISDTGRGAATQTGTGKNAVDTQRLAAEARNVLGGYSREYLLRRPTSLGYACACPTPDAPTRPAVVLDPFAGTGTTVAVAHHLGRHGIGIDLSRDYLRLAEWRCTHDTRLRDKVLERAGLPKAPTIEGQLGLFGEAG